MAGEIGGILNGQSFLPVSPVAILDAEGDGCAYGLAVADAGKDIGAVFFDFLAATATVAELTAVQFVIDEIEVHGQGSREAREEGEERLSVRFTGSVEAKHGNFEEAV